MYQTPLYQPPIVWIKTRYEYRSRQLIPGSSLLSSRATKFMFDGKERLSTLQQRIFLLSPRRAGIMPVRAVCFSYSHFFLLLRYGLSRLAFAHG